MPPKQATPDLCQHYLYSLISLQYLFTEVDKCDLVDKQQLHKAIEEIYTSCIPLGENGGGAYSLQSFDQYLNHSLKINWSACRSTTTDISLKSTDGEAKTEFSFGTKSVHGTTAVDP